MFFFFFFSFFFLYGSDFQVLSWSHPQEAIQEASLGGGTTWSSHWQEVSLGIVAGLIGVVTIAQAEREWGVRSPVKLDP